MIVTLARKSLHRDLKCQNRSYTSLAHEYALPKSWLISFLNCTIKEPGAKRIEKILRKDHVIQVIPKNEKGQADEKALAESCYRLRPDLYPDPNA